MTDAKPVNTTLGGERDFNPSTIIAAIYAADSVKLLLVNRDAGNALDSITVPKDIQGIAWPEGFDPEKTNGFDFNLDVIEHFKMGNAKGPKGEMTKVVLRSGKEVFVEDVTPLAAMRYLEDERGLFVQVSGGDESGRRKDITFVRPERHTEGGTVRRTPTGRALGIVGGGPKDGAS